MTTYLISIWRPEATDDPDSRLTEPFDGVETYTVESEAEALALADKLADAHPTWKFHIDAAKPWHDE